MGPGRSIGIIKILAIILIGCSFIVGTVSAFGVMHYWTDSYGRTWSGFWDSRYDQNQNHSMCVFGSPCGHTEMVVTLGKVRFSATPTSGPSPLKVQFSSNPTSDIDSWSWDFGDGSYGSGMNPLHTYTTSGTYTVKLTIRTEQAFGDGPDSAYIAWGQENTFVEPDMVQVGGSAAGSMVDLVLPDLTGQNNLVTGMSTPVVNEVQPGSFVQHVPGKYRSDPIQKIGSLYSQSVKSSPQVTRLPSWTTGILGSGR